MHIYIYKIYISVYMFISKIKRWEIELADMNYILFYSLVLY